MSRFWQSFFYGLIVTASIMGPAYGFGVFYTIATGGDAVAWFVDCVKLAFVCIIFSTWGLYELQGMLDRANRPRNHDDENGNGENGSSSRRGHGNPDDGGDKHDDLTK